MREQHRSVGAVDLATLGFATSLAMWTVGYVARLPSILLPGPALLVLLLLCLAAGGFATGRFTGRGVPGGIAVGLLASIINLLVLGGLLTGGEPNRIVPSALWWVPGSLLVGALAGASGAALGALRGGAPRRDAPRRDAPRRDAPRRGTSSTTAAPGPWVGVFATVAAAGTLVLVAIGGVVTGYDAGLAVVDWPNSFGYAMFLYPLSRMTGGIYFEHTHRLFGSLIGLTTVVLAVYVFRCDRRRGARLLSVAAVAIVVAQGVLGGLRVTGRFTLSDDPGMMNPNLHLAALHGVLGQVFFSIMASLAVVTSRTWLAASTSGATASTSGATASSPGATASSPGATASSPGATASTPGATASTPPGGREPAAGAGLRFWAAALPVVVLVQTLLGASVRHFSAGLMVHIILASIALLLAVVCGTVVSARYEAHRSVARTGVALVVVVVLQIVLGFLAWAATRGGQAEPGAVEVLLTSLHQVNGALLLGIAVATALWTRRIPAADQPSGPAR